MGTYNVPRNVKGEGRILCRLVQLTIQKIILMQLRPRGMPLLGRDLFLLIIKMLYLHKF